MAEEIEDIIIEDQDVTPDLSKERKLKRKAKRKEKKEERVAKRTERKKKRKSDIADVDEVIETVKEVEPTVSETIPTTEVEDSTLDTAESVLEDDLTAVTSQDIENEYDNLLSVEEDIDTQEVSTPDEKIINFDNLNVSLEMLNNEFIEKFNATPKDVSESLNKRRREIDINFENATGISYEELVVMSEDEYRNYRTSLVHHEDVILDEQIDIYETERDAYSRDVKVVEGFLGEINKTIDQLNNVSKSIDILGSTTKSDSKDQDIVIGKEKNREVLENLRMKLIAKKVKVIYFEKKILEQNY